MLVMDDHEMADEAQAPSASAPSALTTAPPLLTAPSAAPFAPAPASTAPAGKAAAGASGLSAPLSRAISPPTPAPSPQPERARLHHGGASGSAGGPSSSAAGPSSTPSSSVPGSPARPSVLAPDSQISDGKPFNGQSVTKDVMHQFQNLSPQARLDLISALIGSCTKQELAHISRMIGPRLRVDFLAELPVEISLHVLSFVEDPRTLARASCVSRFWRSLVNDEQTWAAMCHKYKIRTKKVPTHQPTFGASARVDAKGKGRLRDELDDLRKEADEEASILPSLYERYRARGLDPSNALDELRTLHALFLSKQEGNDGAVMQLSAQDAAFYAQLEDIVAEEIRDRYGKTRDELATPIHQRYRSMQSAHAHANQQTPLAVPRDVGQQSNIGRLSAGPASLVGLIGNVLSPTAARAGGSSSSHSAAAAAAAGFNTGPRGASANATGDNMEEDAADAGPSTVTVTHHPTWWEGAAAAAAAAVAQTPVLGGGFAGGVSAGSSTSHVAASLLRTPNVRLPISGIGSAFSHGLNALGLERNALLRFAGSTSPTPFPSEADTAIGCFDGETLSHSTTRVSPNGTRSSARASGRAKRPRPQSSLGLGIPSTSERGRRDGLAKRTVSYKEQFKLAYQTESNWLRGGRLLSQYACASDHGTVTALAMDADWILLGMSNNKIHVFNAHTGLFVRTLLGHISGVWCLSLIAGSGSNAAARGGSVPQQTMVVTDPDDNDGRPYLAASDGSLKLINHDATLGALDDDGATGWPPSGSDGQDSLGHEETLQWFHRTRLAMLRREQAGNAMDEDAEPLATTSDSEFEPRSRAYSSSAASSSQLNEPWSASSQTQGPADFSSQASGIGNGKAQNYPTGSVPSYGNAGPMIVSAGSDREIRVWDLLTGECLHVLRGHTATVRCLKVVAGRPLAVSGARDHSVRVWDLERGEMVRLLAGHEHSVRCLEVAGNKIASGSYDATCRIWDVDTGQCLHVLTGHHHQIYSIAFDGEKVATGSLDATVRVWNAHTGECLALFQGHTSLVGTLQLTDRVLVTGGSDGRVIIFSLETYECLHRLCAHDNSVTCLQFDERFIVTGGNDGSVKLWDSTTGKFIRELGQPSEQVLKMAYREDKCVIVCLRDNKPSMEIISFRPVTSA